MMNQTLKSYIESIILPQYEHFDKGHSVVHVTNVIRNSLALAQQFPVNVDMVYVIAAFHDLGLQYGRERHHFESGRLLIEDETLRQWFTPDQLSMMRDAVEDHRASNDYEPRTIYGKIVAEADREIVPKTIIRRTIQYGLKQQPHADMEAQFVRCCQHLENKYGKNGYLKLWLNDERNMEGLRQIRALLEDSTALRIEFEKIYEEEK